MEDEQMLQEIRKTNPNSSVLFVVDTRPKVRSLSTLVGIRIHYKITFSDQRDG